MAFVGDAMRFVTSTVDARLVTPVANRLANSVANPYVLSFLVWDRIKKLTPQRARDLTRLLSSAVANGVGVLSADEAKRLGHTAHRLQDELVAATATPQGKSVVLNSVATAAKVAQALNTPETKVATQQLFETLQSLVDFFASPQGHKVIATAGECVTRVCEVLASPESAVLLAEVGTNLCHALEVEALRRDAEAAAAAPKERAHEPKHQEENVCMADEYKPSGRRASLSSGEDSAFETESEWSLPSRATTPAAGLYDHRREYTLSPRAAATAQHEINDRHGDSESAAVKIKERSALRSARIEKDVLLKMGVNPSMLEDVQRILDQLREEQQREEAAACAPILPVPLDGGDEEEGTDDEDAVFSSAFGTRSSSLPLDPEPPLDPHDPTKTENEEVTEGVILPEWHPEPVRAALRRRHVAAEQQAAARHTFDDQSRDMTQLLAQRQVTHGEMSPGDMMACRVITYVLIIAFAMLLFVVVIAFSRRLLG